jgi:hypothetical protein
MWCVYVCTCVKYCVCMCVWIPQDRYSPTGVRQARQGVRQEGAGLPGPGASLCVHSAIKEHAHRLTKIAFKTIPQLSAQNTARMHTHTHTHIGKQTQKHAYTHTHTLSLSLSHTHAYAGQGLHGERIAICGERRCVVTPLSHQCNTLVALL